LPEECGDDVREGVPAHLPDHCTGSSTAAQELQDTIDFFFSETGETGGLSQAFIKHLQSLNRRPAQNETGVGIPPAIDFLSSKRPVLVKPQGVSTILTASELQVYNHVMRSHCSNAEANEWIRILTKVSCEKHVLYMTCAHEVVFLLTLVRAAPFRPCIQPQEHRKHAQSSDACCGR
jgi:hypothetical protein